MRALFMWLAIATAALLATGSPPARAGGSGYFGSYAELGTFTAAASFDGEPAAAVTKIHPGQDFSLIFTSTTHRLTQATFRLTHPALGEIDVFLVPLQPDARGPIYEAVFN